MHPYITDSAERGKVPLLLASISILLAWLLGAILTRLHLSVPWWVDAPSVTAFYAGLFGLFDRYCWKWRIIQKLGLVRVPVIRGKWSGYIISSHDGHSDKHNVKVDLQQTWTRMCIRLEGTYSRSHSFTAAVLVDAPDGVAIDYEYQNEPISGAIETMNIHHGTARLLLLENRVLEGYYYTGRGRGNYGRLHLSRQK